MINTVTQNGRDRQEGQDGQDGQERASWFKTGSLS
jgi:hypothetical protein